MEKKKFEYRTKTPKKEVKIILVYKTYPIMKVVRNLISKEWLIYLLMNYEKHTRLFWNM